MAVKLSYNARMDRISRVANRAQMQKKIIQTKDFVITTYCKITNPNDKFVFYIEGDGLIYYDDHISDNPTPLFPLVLELAAIDLRPNIVYIARPCQCTIPSEQPICRDNSYWTKKRFAPEVVAAVSEVINEISQGNRYDLIGYSGGGGIAVLVATLNPNKVRSIITIAANLDHVTFNNYHNSLPMEGSLNPIDYAQDIAHIPQLHLAGMRDDIVPPSLVKAFVRKANSSYVKILQLKGVNHSDQWKRVWYKLLRNDSFDDFLIVNNILLKN